MAGKRVIKNPIDFLIAQTETETEIAKEIVESIRQKSDSSEKYYEEKLAQKMLEFFREEEKVIALYAEAKTNYHIMAELMENKRPYLKDLLGEAKKLYEKSLLEK